MEILINGTKVDETTVFEYKANPKRPGFKAHARYAIYEAATSLEEYNELNVGKYGKPDLRYDEEHGHLILKDEEGEILNAKD